MIRESNSIPSSFFCAARGSSGSKFPLFFTLSLSLAFKHNGSDSSHAPLSCNRVKFGAQSFRNLIGIKTRRLAYFQGDLLRRYWIPGSIFCRPRFLGGTRMSSRRRPLHTCGVSILTVAHRAYAAAQDLNGPLGSVAKRMDKIVTLASPLVHAMQCQWLAILCFADDHILVAETMIERHFPPSKSVFNKIDHLVGVTETLPEKFDYAVNRFPTIIHQFPFLDWALVHLISLLNFFISTLTHWGSQNTREKEIMVDINCNNHNHNSALVDKLHNTTESPIHAAGSAKNGEFPPISETQPDKTVTACVNVQPDSVKGTYKDVLEKGTKEDMDHKDGTEMKSNNPKNDTVIQDEIGKGEKQSSDELDENISKDDPILELFESGWLMKPGTSIRDSSLSHSGSEA